MSPIQIYQFRLFIDHGGLHCCRGRVNNAVLSVTTKNLILLQFLNQAHAGHRPAHAWFLKIDPMWIVGMRVCVCVCVRTRGY